MPLMEIPIEILFSKDAAGEVVLTVEFTYSGGSPAHMGSLTYPGHPAEPPEIEIAGILWPFLHYSKEKRKHVPGFIDMPESGLPMHVMDAIHNYIAENFNPRELDEPDY